MKGRLFIFMNIEKIKYKFKNSLTIEKCYISDQFECIDFDILSIVPYEANDSIYLYNKIINLFSFKNAKSSDEIVIFDACSNNVVYLYFEIENDIEKNVVFTIHNNYKKMKIWKNNKFISFLNGWYSRIPMKLEIGESAFLIEVENINKNDILLMFQDLSYPIITNDFIIYDDLIDVKRNYILLLTNIIDEKGNIYYSIRNDDKLIEKTEDINCHIGTYVNLETKSNETCDIKILDTFKSKINEKIQYNINRIPENEIILGSILIGFSISCIKSKQYPNGKKYFWTRVYIKNELNPYIMIMNNNILQYIENEKNDWKKERFNYNYNYIEGRNCDIYTKYYLYMRTLIEMINLNSYNSYDDYIYSEGIKKIFMISELDLQLYKFSIYIPENFKITIKFPIIIIIVQDDSGAFIDLYSELFPNDYLIVECSTRGKTFGNNISESTILEVLNYMKNFYDVDSSRIYLFGHSSSGTVASSLISKYPHIFASALITSCLSNIDILKNTKNNLIINICGELDENIDLHYYQKQDITYENKNFYNILVENYNNALVTNFLKNKSLIEYILQYQVRNNNEFEYYTDNLYYGGYNNIEVIKKINYKAQCSFKYMKSNDEYNLITNNISILKVTNAMNKKISLKSENSYLKIDKCLKDVLYIFIKRHTINYKYELNEFEIAKYRLEIINVFLGPLRLISNLHDDELDLLKNFSTPKKICDNQSIIIKYPIYNYKSNIHNYIKKNNYIFFNYNIEEYLSSFDYKVNYIKCCKDGFLYKNKFYSGEYSIIQILPNFIHFIFFVAFVNFNIFKSAKRNIFLRTVILPSDNSANNTFYRNIAIIHLNDEYYCIAKYGDDIQKMI